MILQLRSSDHREVAIDFHCVLRQANVETTQNLYIKPVSEHSVEAMARLDAILWAPPKVAETKPQ